MNDREATTQLDYMIGIINKSGRHWLDKRDIPILKLAIDALTLKQKMRERKDELLYDVGEPTEEERIEYFVLKRFLE